MISLREERVAAQSQNAVVSGAGGMDGRIELRCTVFNRGDDVDAKLLGDDDKGVVGASSAVSTVPMATMSAVRRKEKCSVSDA